MVVWLSIGVEGMQEFSDLDMLSEFYEVVISFDNICSNQPVFTTWEKAGKCTFRAI